MNSTLSPDKRASLVEAQMTLDEKLRMLHGLYAVPANFKGNVPPNVPPQQAVGSAGFVYGVPRLGIPPLQESDASIGVADPVSGVTGGPVRGTAGYSTALPSGLNTAATFNPSVAYDGGAMIGTEAHEEGFNVLLAGGADLARDPRNGRNFEYAGEDPWLAGVIVAGAVRGIQDQHVISTLKHYAINDQEVGRNTLSSNIDWAAAHESDLFAFEMGVRLGHPGSIMCAYNRVNEVYACSNQLLLTDILKGQWGFPGWVMSDWGAVHSTYDAAAGLDQESGDYFDAPTIWFSGPRLKAFLNEGRIAQSRVDDMVFRILRSMFAVGLFDDPPVITPINATADALISQHDAEQGAVLLKNANRQLPLNSSIKSIAIIGGHADVGVLEGGGSSEVWPVGGPAVTPHNFGFPHPIIYDPSSPMKAIEQQAPGATVLFDDGKDPRSAAKLAASSDVAIVFVTQWLAESIDAKNLHLPNMQDTLISAVAAANRHTIVVLETGDPVVMPWLSQVSAVLEAWYPGSGGGAAIGNLLFGMVNPSGHLPITFPTGVQQLPRPKEPGLSDPNGYFDVNYDIEGAAVGYKWFDKNNLTPLFPFGFGLSYTTFAYSHLHASNSNDHVTVEFDVRNTGKVAGWAVPQVYLGFPEGVGEAPRRLVGFQKVALMPGQTQHVSLSVEQRLLGMFDDTTGNRHWYVTPGQYQVVLGESSRDFKLNTTVTLTSANIAP